MLQSAITLQRCPIQFHDFNPPSLVPERSMECVRRLPFKCGQDVHVDDRIEEKLCSSDDWYNLQPTQVTRIMGAWTMSV